MVLQRTLASSVCKQSEVPESWVQSNSLSSVPLHCTLSRSIGPVPFPKKADERAVASVDEGKIQNIYLSCGSTYIFHCDKIKLCVTNSDFKL